VRERVEAIYAAVRRIPKGRVATYGQIARLAGLPRRARLVGHVLGGTPRGVRVPWHRVINAGGKISRREHPDGELQQRALLEREKVVFGRTGRVSLAKYQWRAGL
jgi:methylated-DNA-protein-cysteine methyltransferase-like protein